jgi:subtilisin family serine protease
MGITNFPVAHITGRDNTPAGLPYGHCLNVNVAVMDTGVDLRHWIWCDTNGCSSYYTNNLLNFIEYVECADPGTYADDWNGHGTHVSGIIGAMDRGFGVVGVAPGARIHDIQVMGPTQSTWTNFLAGVDYIVQHADEIEVANASLEGLAGTNHPSAPATAIRQAISNAVSHGIVFVVAAGNDGYDVYGPDGIFGTADDILPASAPEALTVSAMNS